MTHERLAGNPFQLGMFRERNYETADNLPQHYGSSWYFSRKEIEDFSPSRKDGIDLKKESGLRMCYCSFLKDFGMRLGVPQVTIATAIMFCHRFYLHQSHTKNDWQTVATVCIFLASKVEDTPLALDKVVITAYETIYRKDPATARRIHQKDIFEKQKALIIIGERLLLSTIRFDFNIQHPYKPLLHALKKFGMAQKEVRQVAWNFVNDSLRTTLCLQYKPHYIAAGSVFLAAKLHNVKLPSERGYVWWHEFDVTPQQLHAAIQEMMELFGYKRRPVVTRALEKPTQTPLGRKEEASSSPDSCVLSSRPGSSQSRSNQCSDGLAGIKKPVDLVPSNSNVDGKHACVTGITELQCHARDSESPDSIIEDCQVSGEGSGKTGTNPGKTGTNPKQVVDIEDCQASGDAVDEARMKSEQVADVISHEGPSEGVDQASTKPEQVANVEDCQGSDECVEEARMKSEKVADVISHEGSSEGVDQASTRPQQVANIEDCQGSGECVDQARTVPEQVAYIEDCQGSEEGEARKIPEKIADIEDHQGSDVSLDQAASYVEKAIVIDPPTNPEQVVIIKDCRESGKGMGQTRRKLERVADSLSKVDMDRIKGMMKKRKRERENSKRTEVMHDSIEDAWIERELEIGIELTAKSSEKKRRLA